MPIKKIYLIVSDVRSSYNVGSLLRTADGLGIQEVYLCGYTPYPIGPNDSRLPHISRKTHLRIHKTALGAESTQKWQHMKRAEDAITLLHNQGITLVALEQAKHSTPLTNYKPVNDLAIVVGNEATGINKQLLGLCDHILEIPMAGRKESFNVTVAAAIALFYLKEML